MAAGPQTASALVEPTTDFGAIYEENYGLLVGTAMHFRISEIDAQALAHEVFLAYFLKAGEIVNSRAWLVSAVCNASKYYLRKQAREVALQAEAKEAPDPRLQRIGDSLPDQLAARQVFACLTARCQVALRLRYLEGYRMWEVAEELNISEKYADKLVRRCLQKARERYWARGEQHDDRP